MANERINIDKRIKGGEYMSSNHRIDFDTNLTKDQTEAIKQFAGVDEFYPNFWEVQEAGKIFKAKMSTFSQAVANGDTSANAAINSAAAAVWSQARRYQSEKQSAEIARTTANQAQQSGIKRLFRSLLLKLSNS